MRIHNVEVERVITRYGRLYVPSADSTIGRSLKLYGEWAENEIESVSAFIVDRDTILDIGANIGTHSIAFAWRFPSSEIHAFEPQNLAYSLLIANLFSTRRENVFPYEIGCGEVEQTIKVQTDHTAPGWNMGAFNLIDNKSAEGLPVQIVRLDDLRFGKRVRFIKIDVEGMEMAVISGAQALIERDRPTIFFEVLDLARLAPIRALLLSLNYELRWLNTDAFNPRNFLSNPENVWAKGEVGILALPIPNDPRAIKYSLVTGLEQGLS